MQLSRDELLSAYRTMATARHFEESVFQNFSDGKIPGFVHLSAGQEATAGRRLHGAGRAGLDRGRPIARTASASPAASTCRRPWTKSMARPPASAAARAARCTLRTSTRGCWARTGSSARPVLWQWGAGLSARAKGENGVAVAFYGDGGSNQGLIFEAYNLANIWKLPVIFICEGQRLCRGDSLILFGRRLAGGPREWVRNAGRRGRRIRLLRGLRRDERGGRTRPQWERARA